MTTLRVWMLGSFEVELRGTRLTDQEWRSRQVRTILKYLLTRRDHVVTVDQLIELLWPAEDPAAARRRVYVRTSQLRRLLNPDDATQFILTVDGGYRINPGAPLWLDVAAFEARIAGGQAAQEAGDAKQAIEALEEARALYRGDFLEEELYEGWTTIERERLREKFLTLLLESAECYARQGRYRRAVTRCRQLLTTDPVREAVYVRMMRYHYHAGERDQALRAYARCREVLAEQLGVDPLPETRDLARQIAENTLDASTGLSSYPARHDENRFHALPYSLGRPPFVGRTGPYRDLAAALRGVIERDAEPAGSAILLSGTTGVGKTRLAREAVAALGDAAQIRIARGYNPEDAAPYQAVLDLLQSPERESVSPLTASVAAATIDPAGSDKAARQDLFAGAAELLRVAARRRPLILFLDDAQRLDDESISLCEFLVAGSAHLPVAWLFLYRDDEPDAAPLLEMIFDHLREQQRLIEIRLAPLHRSDALGLLDGVTAPGALPPSLARRIVAACDGNPLYLLSTVQNLFEQQVLHRDDDGHWHFGDEDAGWLLPPSLEDVLRRRIEHLDDAPRRVLEIAAVAGQPLDVQWLERAAGMARAALIPAVDALERGRLIAEAGRDRFYEVSHDQLRTAVYHGLSAEQRQTLHRRVAEALQVARGADPAAAAALTHHYHAGGQPSTAIKYALRAGEYALHLYANRQAITHFDRARQWAEQADLILERQELAALYFHHATALRRIGEHDRAQALLEKGLPLARGEMKQVIYYTLCSVQAQRGGDLTRINHVDPELEAELIELGDSWALAFLYWNQSFWYGLRGERERARRTAAAGWRVARRLRGKGMTARPMAIATAHLGLARTHRWWAAWRRSLWHGRRALALSTVQSDRNGMANAHATVGAALCGLGQWTAAERELDRCFEIAAEAGDPRLQAEAHYRRGVIALLRGDLATAASYAARTLTEAAAIGDILRLALGQQLEARIALAAGRPQDALPLLRRQLQIARAVNATVIALQMACYLAKALWQAGETTEAAAVTAAGMDEARTSGQRRELSGFLGIAARAAAAGGDCKTAIAHADEAERVTISTDAPFDVARARVARGEILLAAGKAKAARTALVQAADTLAALGAAGARREIDALLDEKWPVAHES